MIYFFDPLPPKIHGGSSVSQFQLATFGIGSILDTTESIESDGRVLVQGGSTVLKSAIRHQEKDAEEEEEAVDSAKLPL